MSLENPSILGKPIAAPENPSAPEAPSVPSKSVPTAETLNAQDKPDEQAGVPRWLKVTAVAIPVVATIIGGAWTAATFYAGTVKTLAETRVKEQVEIKGQEEAKREAARLRYEAEREQTERLKLQQQFVRLSADQNNQFQLSMQAGTTRQREAEAEQSKSAARVADAEAANANVRLAEIEATATRTAAADVSKAIADLTNPDPTLSREAALISLEAHVGDQKFRRQIIVALEVRSARPFLSLSEAMAAIRLMQALLPDSFDVLARIAFTARERAIPLGLRDAYIKIQNVTNEGSPSDELREGVRRRLCFAYDSRPIPDEVGEVVRDVLRCSENSFRRPQGLLNAQVAEALSGLPSVPGVMEVENLLWAEAADILVNHASEIQKNSQALGPGMTDSQRSDEIKRRDNFSFGLRNGAPGR